MIQSPPYKITFPCPSCAYELTIQTTYASAPCPNCNQHIEIQLSTSVVREQREREEAPVIKLRPNNRRFRPSTTAANLDDLRAHKFAD